MTEETRQQLEYIIDKLRLELHTGLSREELINLIQQGCNVDGLVCMFGRCSLIRLMIV